MTSLAHHSAGHATGPPVGQRLFRLGLATFATMLLLGGAGLYYPLIQCLLELLALVMLAISIPSLRRVDRLTTARAAFACAAAIPLLLVVQLIPLPPGLWSSLPGRELAVSAAASAGLAGHFYPLSLAPDATERSLLALLPPLAAFLWTAGLSTPQRLSMLGTIAAVAVAGAVLGAFQVAYVGTPAFHLFDTTHLQMATGLFTNRNHHATMMLVGIVAAAAWARGRRREALRAGLRTWTGWILSAVVLLLILGLFSTASRTGLFLLPVALAAAAAIFWQEQVTWRRTLAGLVSLVAVTGLLAQTALVQRTLARFDTVGDDLRYDFWATSVAAIGRTLPWGTGFGSFTAYYPSVEPLAQITPAFPNHAHSDWLELILEGGLPALLLAAVILILFVVAAVAGIRRGGRARTFCGAATAGLLIILLHSLDDYPLRMTALSVVFGALLGLPLMRGAASAAPSGGETSRQRSLVFWKVAAVVATLLLAWRSVAGAVAVHVLQAGSPEIAVQIDWWSTRNWTVYAEQNLREGRNEEAVATARRALAISPIDVAALRNFGFALLASGRDSEGRAAMRVAGQLGWRDLPTQAWLVDRALDENNVAVAGLRLDALLRQNIVRELIYARLGPLLDDPAIVRQLAARLAERPAWRRGFFYGVDAAAPENVAGLENLVRGLRASSAPVTADEAARIARGLVRAHRSAEALRIWQAAGHRLFIADPGFEEPAGSIGSTDNLLHWSAPRRVGVSVTRGPIDRSWRGAALSVNSQGLASGAALEQALLLPPGRYRLRYAARVEGAAPANAAWNLTCRADGRVTPIFVSPLGGSPGRDGWLLNDVAFEIPASDCPVQLLILNILPNAGGAYDIRLDDVAIGPA